MDRNSLSEAEEDDFLEAVRSSIRAEGRSRVLDAIFSQEEVADSLAEAESDSSSDRTEKTDESLFSDDTDDVNSVDDNIEKVDYIKLHEPIIHDHIHCPTKLLLSYYSRKGERRRLPNCAVARVRQIFPSDTGFYMGFKESWQIIVMLIFKCYNLNQFD